MADRAAPLVSDSDVRIFQWVWFLLCEIMDVFGTVTNIINILCFTKQGFKDPVNVSLLGLAISDLGCLVTLLWSNICLIPAFQESNLPFDSMEVQYLVTAWPHVAFTRVTSWITAFITFERCLCVTMPLKVHRIITSKRVTIIIACIFTTLIGSISPVYYVNKLGMKYSPMRNKTILGLVFTGDRETVEQITYAINNVFVPFSSFLVIIICVNVLVVKLRKQTKWRQKNANSVNNPKSVNDEDSASLREQRVAKMVVMISTLFIICFIPSGIIFLAMATEPQLSMGGKYQNTLVIIFGLGVFLESANSSVNIFIYYYMSSKYKTAFQELFSKRKIKKCAS